jgi:hypothetical protein
MGLTRPSAPVLVRTGAAIRRAINIMQRRGVGEVIHNSGHKIIDLETGEPLVIRGPDAASDEDFCAAVAP